jgi:hypothetical protein
MAPAQLLVLLMGCCLLPWGGFFGPLCRGGKEENTTGTSAPWWVILAVYEMLAKAPDVKRRAPKRRKDVVFMIER